MKKTYINKLSINNGTADTPLDYVIKTVMPFSIAELESICNKAIEVADKDRIKEINQK